MHNDTNRCPFDRIRWNPNETPIKPLLICWVAISPLFLVFMAHHRDRFRFVPAQFTSQGTGWFFFSLSPPCFGLKFNEEISERPCDFW